MKNNILIKAFVLGALATTAQATPAEKKETETEAAKPAEARYKLDKAAVAELKKVLGEKAKLVAEKAELDKKIKEASEKFPMEKKQEAFGKMVEVMKELGYSPEKMGQLSPEEAKEADKKIEDAVREKYPEQAKVLDAMEEEGKLTKELKPISQKIGDLKVRDKLGEVFGIRPNDPAPGDLFYLGQDLERLKNPGQNLDTFVKTALEFLNASDGIMPHEKGYKKARKAYGKVVKPLLNKPKKE